MMESRDKTREVENRLRAIQVNAQDTCAFWTPRDGSFVMIQQCQHCFYGQFNAFGSDIYQSGLCKFKR